MTAETVRVLMLILYCTGLRFGEAVRLHLKDIDLQQHLFIIRESKGRTRIVPFKEDLAREINRYLVDRGARVRLPEQADAFFLGRNGRALTIASLSNVIRRLLRQDGIKPLHGRIGARPYDFRHSSGTLIVPAAAGQSVYSRSVAISWSRA